MIAVLEQCQNGVRKGLESQVRDKSNNRTFADSMQSWKQRARVYDMIMEQICLRSHEINSSILSKKQKVVVILYGLELFISSYSSGNWRSLRRESGETCQSVKVSYGFHEVSEGRRR